MDDFGLGYLVTVLAGVYAAIRGWRVVRRVIWGAF